MNESPHTARAKELYGDGPRIDENLKPTPTMIKPGTYGDGLPRMGTKPETIHRDERPAYEHSKARAYRQDLGARPSAKPHKRFPKP